MGSGGTIITLSSPNRNHCGTDTTGWLNGRLPKKIGIIVNESICFASGSDECLISLVFTNRSLGCMSGSSADTKARHFQHA
ncbi:unnamed protein product [Rotaria magnacalcarata]|uniref:Uncharacterized protein n=1 Tax=Rotaria magnacalcarata TaxID=392030 RepID=A0A817ANN1_9BILA|nr:unnamed protein product [Rotaria magnacalcarata]CAF1334861.1 unnamed protein product [Rotaria magnacalcarata]CAF2267477.1 unnamed protein product [Rotaria magnacalcarata]CAF3911729.1 unnamed protein product [Rotaria magnacalcarata]CAF3979566.1 unnamed protein product [Rotaria magnacalcarata]